MSCDTLIFLHKSAVEKMEKADPEIKKKLEMQFGSRDVEAGLSDNYVKNPEDWERRTGWSESICEYLGQLIAESGCMMYESETDAWSTWRMFSCYSEYYIIVAEDVELADVLECDYSWTPAC